MFQKNVSKKNFFKNKFLELRAFEASSEQNDKKEIEMDDKLQRLQRENEDSDRQVEGLTAENNSLKKAVEDMEVTLFS